MNRHFMVGFKSKRRYSGRIAVVCILLCLGLSSVSAVADDHNRFPDNFTYNPVPDSIDNVSAVSPRSADAIIAQTDWVYEKITRNASISFPNPELARLHKFYITYDEISRLRYNRGVLKLPSEKNLPELMAEITKCRWYKEFLLPVTTNPKYNFSEVTAVRIVVSAHTASHFFRIPFPTLFCLLFQESKFDFKVKSHSGALGLGQLTRIGIDQVEILRKNPDEEKRLKAAATHLNNIYNDPVIKDIMKDMGIHIEFPELGPFPRKIKKTHFNSYAILREVMAALKEEGVSYADDQDLVRQLIIREIKGDVLRGRYAPVHGAVLRVTEKKYGRTFGNILNIETNILISAMLLRFYLDYDWRIRGKKINIHPSLRTIMAIAAYNQGQSPIIRYIRQMTRDYPGFNIEKATADDLKKIFTKQNISKVFSDDPGKTEEIFRHVLEIKSCSNLNVDIID